MWHFSWGAGHGSIAGNARRGAGRYRAGAHGLHVAGRSGRRGRAHRTRRVGRTGRGAARALQPPDAQPLPGRRRLEAARHGRAGAGPGRARRRAGRRVPAGRGRAAGPGAAGMPGAQPAPGVRPHDRMGAVRAAGAGGRARPELRRADRHHPRHRACRPAAVDSAGLDRRHGRRRAVPGAGRGGRLAGAQPLGPGPGHRRRHRRRRGVAGHGLLRPVRGGAVAGRARHQHPGQRRAFLRCLRVRRWRLDLGRPHRGALLRAIAGEAGAARPGCRRARRPRRLAARQDGHRQPLPYPHPRCMVRLARGFGCLLRAGPVVRRGAGACAPEGARHVRRGRWRGAAGARPALWPHAAGHAPAAVRVAGQHACGGAGGRTPPATPRPPSESPDSTLAAVLARWAAEDEARRG
ncbi:hypothetical protein L559_0862 [Bordetella pertussis STO1-CHOC-0017]|nr:hypothetical protein L559_0862 [Bordetella pertussis STO1-CHOC-0017]